MMHEIERSIYNFSLGIARKVVSIALCNKYIKMGKIYKESEFHTIS